MSIRSSRLVGLAAAVAIALSELAALGLTGPMPAVGAAPTMSPYIAGRHVYDYAGSMSAKAIATAEKFASSIESAGGGRVVVYTDDLMSLPDEQTLATAWHVDGLLLTGWDDMGTATVGSTLKAKLSAGAAEFIGDSSAPLAGMESWVTSTLARTYGLMEGAHVFDGTGVLDASGLAHAEASAGALASKIGAPVYVDIALNSSGDPHGTAFLNNWAPSTDMGKSLVIALAVDGGQVGGYIDADSDLWDSYETHAPWAYDSLSNEAAPNGDVQAELLRAIDNVQTPLDPGAAAASVGAGIRDALTGFFGDKTNQIDSLLGLLSALGTVLIFAFVRRWRRRLPGYADDDSVLVSGPPADMTPALAALVAAPLDTTRAVTCALLDLAAHGHIAFYQEATPLGQRGGIKVVSASGGTASEVYAGHAVAATRQLGPAEQFLLDGLVSAAGKGATLTDFTELRPLFEQTGEQLERIAGQRGWLRIKTRQMSRVWVCIGLALFVAAVVWATLIQPVAAAAEALAGLIVLPRALRMPLPLRTPNGAITSAMVDAYRRTLRRALSGAPGEVPPWLANAEEAAMWGYAWGLEGEVQAFVGRSVATAMHRPDGGATAGADTASLRSLSMMMGGLVGSGQARPVGLDTDAIAATLNELGPR
jgi:hypothetical protein